MNEMTMRERVARAICRNSVLATARSLRVKPAPTQAWTDNRVEVRWREYLDVADDAIRAMREPSEAMRRASCMTQDIPKPCEGGRIHMWGSNALPAMVDAALSEQP